jgi:hypothetical protein
MDSDEAKRATAAVSVVRSSKVLKSGLLEVAGVVRVGVG